MLRRPEYSPSSLDQFAYREVVTSSIDFAKVVAFFKAGKRIIISWIVAGLMIMLLYAFTAVPEYTAAANLILDAHKIQVFKDAPVVGDNTIDAAQIESQVEIIRSDAIARSVVTKLSLQNDPEFVIRKPNFVMRLLFAALGLDEERQTKSGQDRERAAIQVLRNELGIRR